MIHRNVLPLLAAACMYLVPFHAAYPQDGASAPLPVEEIVVSGFRNEVAKNLDTSITVLNRDDISSATLTHFKELVQLIPNMNLSGEGSRARYFQLRGIGEREQYEGAPNPSVGFIVDDIDLSGIGGISSLFDIRQVDVLRGPQSVRFGSNALAGLVFMQSENPTDELRAAVELTVGDDDIRAVGIGVGGPLTDTIGGRLSVHHYESNGFRDNVSVVADDTNRRDELTVRGKLRWEPAADWEILLSGLYADYQNGYDAWTIDNGDVMWSDNPGLDTQETLAGSLKISGLLGDSARLVSITGAASSEIVFGYDGDWGGTALWAPRIYDFTYLNPRDRDTLSQEIRLLSTPDRRLFNGTTDWLLGVYWQRLDEDNVIDSDGVYDDSAAEAFCPPPPDPFACITDRSVASRFESKKLDLFGSLDSALTGRLSLSFGLRYERWSAEYVDQWQDNSTFPPAAAANRFEPDDSLVGGHLSLLYDWSDRLRGYARIARGFKAGGFNPSLAALSGQPGAQIGPEFIPYGSEYLWNYEVGLKGLSRDGSLSADISVFYMDREDAQLSQSDQLVATDPNSFVFVTSNGGAYSYGLETSAAWQVNPAWRLHGSLGLLQTEVDRWEVRPGVEGRDLAHAPPYTLNLGGTFTSAAGWYARVDLNAIGAYYFDISHDQKSDAYQVVNLKIGKEWGRWSAFLWGRNIFDENYAVRGFYFGNEPPNFANTLYTKFGDPRHFGITMNFSY